MPDTLLQIAILTIFPAGMVLAAISDLFTMTVSNRLTLTLAAAFFVIALWSGMSLETIGIHVAVCIGALVVGIAMFAPGWIGGADAKLIAASALWLGPESLGYYLLYSAVVGGVMTVILLKMREIPLPEWACNQPWIARLHRADKGVPYCIALAAAGLSAYTHSDVFALAVV